MRIRYWLFVFLLFAISCSLTLLGKIELEKQIERIDHAEEIQADVIQGFSDLSQEIGLQNDKVEITQDFMRDFKANIDKRFELLEHNCKSNK